MEKVFYLLLDGLDPNMRYEAELDQTALHAAATSGHLGTLFLLQQVMNWLGCFLFLFVSPI